MSFKKYSKIPLDDLKKYSTVAAFLLLAIFVFVAFEIYVPANPLSNNNISYTVRKGMDRKQIAKELKEAGIIRSTAFFNFYVLASLQHASLQAGSYNLSPRMSIHQIAKKMANGGTVRYKAVIYEGWDIRDIGQHLQSKDICSLKSFMEASEKDYSQRFEFLQDKPKDVGLEGYLFPDTYEIAVGDSCDEIVLAMLLNFDKKLDAKLREEIASQKKSIFEIITVASLIEKEVRTVADKKIVSGIIWKRLKAGMPLQLDATVNYITRKNDPAATIKDTQIDSPYNTYKYKGLPKGPISNPGLESIDAALHPTKTDYWFYLSSQISGKTVYSRNSEEHAANKAKYLD